MSIERKDLDELAEGSRALFKQIFVLYPIKAGSLLLGLEVFGAGDAIGLGNLGFFKAYGLVWAVNTLIGFDLDGPPRPVRIVKNKFRSD